MAMSLYLMFACRDRSEFLGFLDGFVDAAHHVEGLACPSSIVPTPIAADVEAVIPLTGNPVPFVSVIEDGVPVAFVRTKADGVPSAGVVNDGLFVKARTPVPDSSLMMLAKSAELPT